MPDFHSAYDGKFTSGRGKRRFNDDDPATAKRVRGRRALPSLEQFDATDGLADGDRWSTWDQTENLVSNDYLAGLDGHTVVPDPLVCFLSFH